MSLHKVWPDGDGLVVQCVCLVQPSLVGPHQVSQVVVDVDVAKG